MRIVIFSTRYCLARGPSSVVALEFEVVLSSISDHRRRSSREHPTPLCSSPISQFSQKLLDSHTDAECTSLCNPSSSHLYISLVAQRLDSPATDQVRSPPAPPTPPLIIIPDDSVDEVAAPPNSPTCYLEDGSDFSDWMDY